jgi:hypothetical protein
VRKPRSTRGRRGGSRLSGAQAPSPRPQLTARIEDIADTHDQKALGYGEPKRMVFFGIRAKA